MKKYHIIIMLVCLPFMTYAINSNLFIRDVRSWGQWDVTVPSVTITTEVCGLYAYSEMTIVFKDTVSTNGSDSMEVNCNFYLPPESVVDSMSLWINGKPEAAYLLDKWRAWQIYSSIVRVRRDPAFLMMNGSTYILRIFPFKQREARTVKINFSSPLMPMGGRLALRMPLDVVGNSLYPPSKVRWEITGSEGQADDAIAMVAAEGVTIEKSRKSLRPVIVATTTDSRLSSTLVCSFNVPAYGDSGYVSSIGAEGDATYFSAMVNVGRALGITQKSSKKVLFVWNGVTTSMSSTYRTEGDCNYNSGGDCHTYYEYTLTKYFQAGQYNSILEALSRFVGTNLFAGDSFNIILNTGDITAFSSNGFVPATTAQCINAAAFVVAAEAAATRNGAEMKTFADLVKDAVQKDALPDSVTIVIIDQSVYYSNGYDTTYVYGKGTGSGLRYYHYSIKNGIDIEALSKQVIAALPAGATVFAVAYPYQYYGNLQLYDKLTSYTNGLVIPSNDQEYAFRSLSEAMMGKLHPASVTITTPGEGYVYDVTGYSTSSLSIHKPLFITGKMYGGATAFTLDIKGKFAGTDYRFSKTLSGASPCVLPGQREVWAAKTVAALKGENSLIAQKEAASLSFKNHILTDFTALLALEPGMDSLLSPEEQAKNGNGVATPVIGKGNTAPVQPPAGMLSVTAGGSGVRITVTTCHRLKGTPMTLEIYDIKGRCVADLTASLLASNGVVQLKRGKLAKGSYVVRLLVGKTLMSRKLTIVE